MIPDQFKEEENLKMFQIKDLIQIIQLSSLFLIHQTFKDKDRIFNIELQIQELLKTIVIQTVNNKVKVAKIAKTVKNKQPIKND